jgi:hypothetical protein
VSCIWDGSEYMNEWRTVDIAQQDARMTNDKFQRIWKETVMTKLWYYLGICLEGLRKSTKKKSIKIVDVPTGI